jgi:hypothetical protein
VAVACVGAAASWVVAVGKGAAVGVDGVVVQAAAARSRKQTRVKERRFMIYPPFDSMSDTRRNTASNNGCWKLGIRCDLPYILEKLKVASIERV